MRLAQKQKQNMLENHWFNCNHGQKHQSVYQPREFNISFIWYKYKLYHKYNQ